MSIYGEGLYQSADGRLIETAERQPRAASGSWDPLDDKGRPLRPVPTPENKRPALASVYAIGKYVQERLTLTLAPPYGMEGRSEENTSELQSLLRISYAVLCSKKKQTTTPVVSHSTDTNRECLNRAHKPTADHHIT